MLTEEQAKAIMKELSYSTSRSGGKGGQNVNKVETKVVILFDVASSNVLNENQKHFILARAKNLIDDSKIQITSDTFRTQLQNKASAQKKLIETLNKLLKPVKKRLATKPSKASLRKKAENKKKQKEKKNLRKRLF